MAQVRGDLLSLSTVYRAVHFHNSRKHVHWVNVNKKPIEQMDFLKRMEGISTSFIIDIDGIVQSHDVFHRRYGWVPRGEECVRHQPWIRGSNYPVHAAFTERGVIHGGWKIFSHDDVCESEFIAFMKHIAGKLDRDSYGLYDNASNQRTQTARLVMQNAFMNRRGGKGRYA